MEFVIARNELRGTIGEMEPQAQSLAIRPDVRVKAGDTLTAVAYDKGAWFMQFLEQRFGREAFDEYLRGYFDHFAFQSIQTTKFVEYTQTNLLDNYPGKATEPQLDRQRGG